MKFYVEDGWYVAQSEEGWFQEYETLEELLVDYPEAEVE